MYVWMSAGGNVIYRHDETLLEEVVARSLCTHAADKVDGTHTHTHTHTQAHTEITQFLQGGAPFVQEEYRFRVGRCLPPPPPFSIALKPAR